MKEYELIKTIKDLIDIDLNIIGDDTAIIKETGDVYTCDTLVEGIHFRLETTSIFDLGYKAAAVNLSDIAASGGICKYLLVALAIPEDINISFIKEFYQGLISLTDLFNCKIIGGDLTRCDRFVITITAIGKTTKLCSRSFAADGQIIVVTGDFGGSFAGLKLLELNKGRIPLNDEARKVLISRHLRPYPRINEAQFFVNNTTNIRYCLMDTSDGLADALYQVAQKSKVTFEIETSKIPITKNVDSVAKYLNIDVKDAALFGGEDFELILTCEEKDLNLLLNNKDFKFTKIGRTKAGNAGVILLDGCQKVELNDTLLNKKISFKHF